MPATAELIRSEFEQANPVLADLRPAPNLPEPSEVPDLFRLIGARPRQYENGVVYFPGTVDRCCVLSAILVNKTTGNQLLELAKSGEIDSGARAEFLGISFDFSDGAQDGFDGRPYLGESTEYRDGHAWGKACWTECVKAGLTEDVAEIDAEVA